MTTQCHVTMFMADTALSGNVCGTKHIVIILMDSLCALLMLMDSLCALLMLMDSLCALLMLMDSLCALFSSGQQPVSPLV